MSIEEPNEGLRQPDAAEWARMHRRTRRSFLVGGGAAVAAAAAYEWLAHARQIGDLQSPLRRAEQWNAAVSRVLFPNHELTSTYAPSRSTELRLNGNIGQDTQMVLDSWRLQVVGVANPRQYPQYIEDVDLWQYKSGSDAPGAQAGSSARSAQPPNSGEGANPKLPRSGGVSVEQSVAIPLAPATDTSRIPGIVLSLDDLRRLPFVEQTTQFRCIEGWSQITSFGGARFTDFLKAYPPAGNPGYVAFETADGTFSSSFDLASLLHPQTLLCYRMNGQPLTPGHGAPLRLATPFKYGYKQIKQIASLTYSEKRSVDFWEGYGYDWYAGL